MTVTFAEKLETYDIRVELEKLQKSGILPERTASACGQAAWLLQSLRETVLNPDLSDSDIVNKLKWILVQHHEG